MSNNNQTLRPCSEQAIYDDYRRMLNNPNLTEEEIEEMDIHFSLFVEAVWEYLLEQNNKDNGLTGTCKHSPAKW